MSTPLVMDRSGIASRSFLPLPPASRSVEILAGGPTASPAAILQAGNLAGGPTAQDGN